MAHHVYTTLGFVIGSLPYGEANRYIYIFTKDLGLVGASARSVRSLKSKLRYGLQEFSKSRVSLVKGKQSWRVTNAFFEKNLFDSFRHDPNKLQVSARIFLLLKRLLAGEEKNEPLYAIVADALDFLERENLTPDELKNFECILVLQVTENLGYLALTENLKKYSSGALSKEIVSSITPFRGKAVREINIALRESQL